MSSEKLKSLKSLGLVVGILVGLVGVAGFIQAWAILPYRVQQTESEVKAMKDERKTDREILIRIEEQVKAMREEMRQKRERVSNIKLLSEPVTLIP